LTRRSFDPFETTLGRWVIEAGQRILAAGDKDIAALAATAFREANITVSRRH
jgi:hypothetical protein